MTIPHTDKHMTHDTPTLCTWPAIAPVLGIIVVVGMPLGFPPDVMLWPVVFGLAIWKGRTLTMRAAFITLELA